MFKGYINKSIQKYLKEKEKQGYIIISKIKKDNDCFLNNHLSIELQKLFVIKKVRIKIDKKNDYFYCEIKTYNDNNYCYTEQFIKQ